MISLGYFLVGGFVIELVVSNVEAYRIASTYLPYCAAVPLLGVAAYQLDGIFLGTTQGAALRSAGLLSAALYVVTDTLMADTLGNHGVWGALLLLYVYRAVCLGAYIPRLFRSVSSGLP